tara:strand:- start:237 stop:1544 length:1308 start_codon:yes stop_codon:yes gene_type:complete
MIEIISIFSQLLIFILITVFPFNSLTLNNKNFLIKNNFAYTIGVNILFLIFILLIFSFFSISQRIIFYFIIFVYLIIFTLNLKKIIKLSWIKKDFNLKFFYFAILFMLFLNVAENLKIGWDAFDIWKFIANNFYLEESFYNLQNREGRAPTYPHLGSYIWSFFWKNSLLEKEYFGRLFYIYIYTTAIFSLVLSIKNISNEKKILLVFFMIISTWDQDLQGYQGYLIFSFLIFFVVALLDCDNGNQKSKVLSVAYFLVCSLLPWIKNESSFYSLFLIILLMTNKNFRCRRNVLLTVAVFISLFGEFFIRKYFFSTEYAFQSPINIGIIFDLSLYDHFKKILMITAYFFRECFKYPIWIFNLIGLAIAFFYYEKSETLKLIALFFIMNLCFLFAIFLLTPIDLKLMLNTTMDRLMLQTSGIYAATCVVLINKSIIRL